MNVLKLGDIEVEVVFNSVIWVGHVCWGRGESAMFGIQLRPLRAPILCLIVSFFTNVWKKNSLKMFPSSGLGNLRARGPFLCVWSPSVQPRTLSNYTAWISAWLVVAEGVWSEAYACLCVTLWSKAGHSGPKLLYRASEYWAGMYQQDTLTHHMQNNKADKCLHLHLLFHLWLPN